MLRFVWAVLRSSPASKYMRVQCVFVCKEGGALLLCVARVSRSLRKKKLRVLAMATLVVEKKQLSRKTTNPTLCPTIRIKKIPQNWLNLIEVCSRPSFDFKSRSEHIEADDLYFLSMYWDIPLWLRSSTLWNLLNRFKMYSVNEWFISNDIILILPIESRRVWAILL